MADQTLVRVGLKGYCYVGDVGATEPTQISDTPASDWGADWTDLGLITQDGLVEALDQARTDVYSWGNLSAPVRSILTKSSFSFQLTFEEESVPVLGLYYAVQTSGFTNVTAASGHPQQLKFNSTQLGSPDVRAMGIDILDGTHVKRYILSRCEATDRGNVVQKGDDVTKYQMTFRPLLDFSDGAAVDVKRFISNLAIPA